MKENENEGIEKKGWVPGTGEVPKQPPPPQEPTGEIHEEGDVPPEPPSEPPSGTNSSDEDSGLIGLIPEDQGTAGSKRPVFETPQQPKVMRALIHGEGQVPSAPPKPSTPARTAQDDDNPDSSAPTE